LTLKTKENEWRDRPDLNRGIPTPEAGALSRLDYGPKRLKTWSRLKDLLQVQVSDENRSGINQPPSATLVLDKPFLVFKDRTAQSLDRSIVESINSI
jgi:hypothetical protein